MDKNEVVIVILLMLCISPVVCGGSLSGGSVKSEEYGLLWTYPVESASPIVYNIDGDLRPEIIFGSLDSHLYVLNISGDLLWKFKADGGIASSPIVHDIDGDSVAEIIFGSLDSHLYVLNVTGGLLWKFKAGGGIATSPVVHDMNDEGIAEIVFGSLDSNVYIVSRGRLKRRVKTLDPIEASPRIADLDDRIKNDIVFGSTDNVLYVIKDMSGILLSYPVGGDILSAPEVTNIDKSGKREIIFGSCDGRIYCLGYEENSTEDGRECTSEGCFMQYILNPRLIELWNYDTKDDARDDIGACFSSPVAVDIGGDRKLEVIVGSSDRNLYILNSTGSPLLKYTVNGPVTSGPVIGDLNGDRENEIIFGTKKSIYAINYSGRRLWDYTVNGSIQSSPVVADIDRDGVSELIVGADVLYVFGSLRDSDGDSISDFHEKLLGLNHRRNDTDRDGIIDSDDPHPNVHEDSFVDFDNDGLSDYEESEMGTNPYMDDTDNDGLPDLSDPHPTKPESMFVDTDNDGLSDYQEFMMGTNPNLSDTDGDGLTDSADQDPFRPVDYLLSFGNESFINASDAYKKGKAEFPGALNIHVLVILLVVISYFFIRRINIHHGRNMAGEKKLVELEEDHEKEMRKMVREHRSGL